MLRLVRQAGAEAVDAHQPARCHEPFFARDDEWYDAKTDFGNIPKRINGSNYNL
ncbi:MAG: hypothetical protein ACI38O_04715 [Fibrobacter intestinalis]|uniref:hypothetical protein n=1 Tax=Fibrobacter intestinalis TaxID=28122 RepID=UPI003EFDB209